MEACHWLLLFALMLPNASLASGGKDLYKVLGIARDASSSEIRRAYHRAALHCHPDKRPGDADAQQEFLRVSAAYDTLSDPQKRIAYDARLSEAIDFENFELSVFGVDLVTALRIFVESLAAHPDVLNSDGDINWEKLAVAVMDAGKQTVAHLGEQVQNATKKKVEHIQNLTQERLQNWSQTVRQSLNLSGMTLNFSGMNMSNFNMKLSEEFGRNAQQAKVHIEEIQKNMAGLNKKLGEQAKGIFDHVSGVSGMQPTSEKRTPRKTWVPDTYLKTLRNVADQVSSGLRALWSPAPGASASNADL